MENPQTKLTDISIALATYNGERYIGEQLDSIASQTRLPDELVISDDASTDSTLEIVSKFARRVPFPVRVHINPERLGSTRNFEVAIRACKGDIIFLCDQDDVWYPEKIALIEECFVNNIEVGAVFTDADVVNQSLDLLEYSLWERLKISRQELTQIATHEGAFKILLNRNIVSGTTMAFRANYLKFILPMPKEWVHDAWIALVISISSGLIALPTPLVAYRQHNSNQIGAPPLPNNNISKIRGKSFHSIHNPKVKAYQLVLDYLIESCANNIPEAKNKILQVKDELAFLRARSSLPSSHWKRVPIVLRELISFRYHRYAKGTKHVVKDLLRKVR
ncbi:MAG: glycosyltransferase [Nitrosomonadales bacterium]|nr:MAG: glycosyltransferase [Nitrosomonadales bacterium]